MLILLWLTVSCVSYALGWLYPWVDARYSAVESDGHRQYANQRKMGLTCWSYYKLG